MLTEQLIRGPTSFVQPCQIQNPPLEKSGYGPVYSNYTSIYKNAYCLSFNAVFKLLYVPVMYKISLLVY